MKRHSLACIIAFAALVSVASTLRAQSQFAGTYTGTINSRVTAPVVGTIEAAAGVYIAGVTAAGEINVSSGVLVGTVSASGAVTFTGGSGIASFGIRSATIVGTTLSSNYGDTLGNGTTQFRLNPSTGFTPASGGGISGRIGAVAVLKKSGAARRGGRAIEEETVVVGRTPAGADGDEARIPEPPRRGPHEQGDRGGGTGERAVDKGAQPHGRRAQGSRTDAALRGGNGTQHRGEVETTAGVVPQQV